MKPQTECLRCILTTRLREIEYSSLSPGEKIVLAKMIMSKLVNDFSLDSTELTRLASDLFQLTVTAPGVLDYYRLVKTQSMRRALALRDAHREHARYLDDYRRLRYLLKVSALGNLIDYGVMDHNFNEEIDPGIAENVEIAIDDSVKFYELVRKGGLKIMFLLDNAGEAVYDSLLVEYLRGKGNTTIGVVKDEPGFQNDVTLNDVIEVGLDKVFDEIVTPGCRSICSSIHLDKVSEDFKSLLNSVDLIIAKGMAHYEYLTDIDIGKPVLHIFIPKCDPISRSLGSVTYRGKPVVYLRFPESKL